MVRLQFKMEGRMLLNDDRKEHVVENRLQNKNGDDTKRGTSTMEWNWLYSLLQQHSKVPMNSNEAFVLDYKITQGFSFVVSSETLLKNGIGRELISADTTNKILWKGIPVSLIGSVDGHRHFQLIALGVSTSEEYEDFKFIFETIKKKALNIFNVQMDPQIILCTARESISNAFLSVFGTNCLVLICWLHVRYTINRNLGRYFVKELQKEVMHDIDRLHLSSSTKAFETASKLFLQKYAAYEQFVSYFDYEWLQKFRNWYVGASIENLRTNNALEMFNNNVKQDELQEKSSFENSFSMLFEAVVRLSQQYENDF